MAEGFLEGGHVVGHVRWMRELGGTVHEVVHGCPSGIPMGEVKVAMTLVVVSWDGDKMGKGRGHPEGRWPPSADSIKAKGFPSLGTGKAPEAFAFGYRMGAVMSLSHGLGHSRCVLK